MKLSKTKIEILMHRLETDCIPDCLSDTEELGISREEAQRAQGEVVEFVESGEVFPDRWNRVQQEVFADAIDGSTWFADLDDAVASDEVTKGQAAYWRKCALEIENDFETATGRSSSFPQF